MGMATDCIWWLIHRVRGVVKGAKKKQGASFAH
jgi:hypothetical protein